MMKKYVSVVKDVREDSGKNGEMCCRVKQMVQYVDLCESRNEIESVSLCNGDN